MTTCKDHETCVSSDSGKSICKCWCAECKEIMSETRKAWKEYNTYIGKKYGKISTITEYFKGE